MNKTLTAPLLALAAGLLLTTAAHAAPDDRAALKERIASMTPEEKAAAKEKARARWDSMTPEQQAAAKERARARWENMSPEEKAQAKQRFEERLPDGARKLRERKDAAGAAR